MHACSVHALVALALLLLIVVAPRAMTHACCVDAWAALAALGLCAALCAIASALVFLAPLAALAFACNAGKLSILTRFPFLDCQVSFL